MSQAQPVIKDDVGVIDPAIKKVRKTFDSNITRPLAFRIKQLKNLKDGFIALEKDISEAVRKDLGREAFMTWFGELVIMLGEIDHTIQHLKKWMRDESLDTPMSLGPASTRIVYEPLGCVLIVGSWNFPLFTTIGPLISAIAAGNVAVIKPSELAPFSSNIIKKLIFRYLDTNAYAPVEGQVQVAIALTSKKFDLICYTGSSEKGKLVAASAAKNLIPCILELGGKSPCIVDQGCDIDYTVKKICFGRFVNFGQTCIAPDYALVHVSKIEAFNTKLKKEVASMWEEGKNIKDMGKVINDFHHNRLCELLRNHGGNVSIGNSNAHEDRNLQPTVILSPDRESPVMKDEIFGPILPVYTYSNFDEVIKMINEGEKPLALYYFGSASSANYKRLEKETSSGALVSNEVLFQVANPDFPFGGVGYSGYGRTHGFAGFKAFSNAKSVFNKQVMTMYPYNQLYPPFTPDKQRLIKTLCKYLAAPQSVFFKRFVYLVLVVLILRSARQGRINKAYFEKVKELVLSIISLIKTTFIK
ncbi:aldehyde dehydrogenase [Stylonychia lemnae]|uniref:Aldehyde dehydrogenase n=1 Tax=Stylonychia lemnae TaxID=5949 RepID=A0A078AQP3_STYLE|nr:aldehyde dehydrogenase [Stylonychia lemnae]|eukprot:CDW83562.1 aldehyde dehydrogenase [Stylonychia lemnae]